MAAPFRRVAILGTGLIGGSFALALRKYSPDTIVIGWDKGLVLRHALERGAINEGAGDLSHALAGAELIYVALPVGQTIELLPEIAKLAAEISPGKFILSHLCGNMDLPGNKKLYREAGYKGEVIEAYDGLRITP